MEYPLCFLSSSVGILPRSWCRYTVPSSMTVIQWVSDFSERIKQLQQISQGAASGGAKELKVMLVYKNKQEFTLQLYDNMFFCFHFSPSSPEHPCVFGQLVCARGLHHCHPPVRGTGQQLVFGRAVSGGQCHHRSGCSAGCLQLRHQRSDNKHIIFNQEKTLCKLHNQMNAE